MGALGCHPDPRGAVVENVALARLLHHRQSWARNCSARCCSTRAPLSGTYGGAMGAVGGGWNYSSQRAPRGHPRDHSAQSRPLPGCTAPEAGRETRLPAGAAVRAVPGGLREGLVGRAALRVRPLSGAPSPGAMRLSALLRLAAPPKLPKGYRHGTWRPGTAAERLRNPPGQRRKKIFVEPISREDWKVFRGDTVSTRHKARGKWVGEAPLTPPPPPQPCAGPGADREGRGEAGDGHPGRTRPQLGGGGRAEHGECGARR